MLGTYGSGVLVSPHTYTRTTSRWPFHSVIFGTVGVKGVACTYSRAGRSRQDYHSVPTTSRRGCHNNTQWVCSFVCARYHCSYVVVEGGRLMRVVGGGREVRHDLLLPWWQVLLQILCLSGESIICKFCSVGPIMLIDVYEQFYTSSNTFVLLQTYVSASVFFCSSFLPQRLVSMWSLWRIRTSSFKVWYKHGCAVAPKTLHMEICL